ncbi:MAG TPA: hypothetical protein VMF66_02635 [Candidatus Acidoferrum sp.]|nr:hypothetical protein [Candidatus Acidoferrum sp.]
MTPRSLPDRAYGDAECNPSSGSPSNTGWDAKTIMVLTAAKCQSFVVLPTVIGMSSATAGLMATQDGAPLVVLTFFAPFLEVTVF